MRKILILMSDTGGGHRSAAEAIAEAFEHDFAGQYHIELIDVFKRAAIFPMNHIPDIYLPMTTYAASGWGLLFHTTDRQQARSVTQRVVSLSITREMRRILREKPADMLVSVHPIFITIPLHIWRTMGATAPFVTVGTDLSSAHGLWYEPQTDLTLVPTEDAFLTGLSWNMPKEKMRVVGFPVNLKFLDQDKSKINYRDELGLDSQRTTVLLVGGGEGMGKLYEIAHAINDAHLALQLVIIAGRNKRLKRKLEMTSWKIPVSIQGFVTNMPDWMRASDVIITKAGSATISEALVCGLPILLSGFVPGQEEGNVTFVGKSGVGEIRRIPEDIARTLGKWLTPGNDTLSRYAARAKELARPRAALDIAHILHDILEKQALK